MNIPKGYLLNGWQYSEIQKHMVFLRLLSPLPRYHQTHTKTRVPVWSKESRPENSLSDKELKVAGLFFPRVFSGQCIFQETVASHTNFMTAQCSTHSRYSKCVHVYVYNLAFMLHAWGSGSWWHSQERRMEYSKGQVREYLYLRCMTEKKKKSFQSRLFLID